jgi:two-component system sensor histidine kinase and response regulator WspE
MPAWLEANAGRIREQVDALAAVKARPAGAPPAPAPASSAPVPESPAPPPASAAAEAPTPEPGPSAPAPSPAAAAKPAAAAPTNEKTVVRVSADNINRLMGLAAEGLVEARRMQPYGDALFQLKQSHQRLSTLLEHLTILTAGLEVDERIRTASMEAVQSAARCRQMLVERITDFEEMSRRSSAR